MSDTDPTQGVYGKYIIQKADGTDVDSQACYFVLRLDKDPAARVAMRAYAAHETVHEKLATGINEALDRLDVGYCNCRGISECPHDFFGDPVWRHGGSHE